MSQSPTNITPVHNDDRIPEHYVDGPIGVNLFNGNLHITFATIRTDHSTKPSPQYRQVTLRLVIPLAGAVDLQSHISRIISLLQAQGTIQPVMPGSQTRQ
jgi:hypothetical protein